MRLYTKSNLMKNVIKFLISTLADVCVFFVFIFPLRRVFRVCWLRFFFLMLVHCSLLCTLTLMSFVCCWRWRRQLRLFDACFCSSFISFLCVCVCQTHINSVASLISTYTLSLYSFSVFLSFIFFSFSLFFSFFVMLCNFTLRFFFVWCGVHILLNHKTCTGTTWTK